MNFWVQPYDPIDEAMQQFIQFNAAAPEDREYSEDELIALAVHKIKQHERSTAA